MTHPERPTAAGRSAAAGLIVPRFAPAAFEVTCRRCFRLLIQESTAARIPDRLAALADDPRIVCSACGVAEFAIRVVGDVQMPPPEAVTRRG